MIKKICCLGDSITNGARNEFFRNYVLELNYLKKDDNYIFFNYSVNGETTGEIINRGIVLFNKFKFDGVIFLGGTNDSKVPISRKIYEKNLIALIHTCKKLNLELIICTVPKIYSGLPFYSQKLGNKFINQYNLCIKNLCKKYKLKTVDLNSMSRSFFPDGIHTNNDGCVIKAKKINDVL